MNNNLVGFGAFDGGYIPEMPGGDLTGAPTAPAYVAPTAPVLSIRRTATPVAVTSTSPLAYLAQLTTAPSRSITMPAPGGSTVGPGGGAMGPSSGGGATYRSTDETTPVAIGPVETETDIQTLPDNDFYIASVEDEPLVAPESEKGLDTKTVVVWGLAAVVVGAGLFMLLKKEK